MKQVAALKRLTNAAIRRWTNDATIFKRGRRYQDNGFVLDLRWTSAGFIATVEGTEDYTTLVPFDSDGPGWPECSCPYDWGPICKHAVAVALEAAEQISNGALTLSDIPDARQLEVGVSMELPDQLASWLDELDRAELVGLLVDAAEQHAPLYNDLVAAYERHTWHHSAPDVPDEAEDDDEAPSAHPVVMAFFSSPDVYALLDVREYFGPLWPEVRPIVGYFMATGLSPLHEDYDGPPWPGAALRGHARLQLQVRYSSLLEDAIEDALATGHLEDALAWFDASIDHRPDLLIGPVPQKLAAHLLTESPRRAFGLWLLHIEARLNAPNPTTSSLTTVVLLLKELEPLMREHGEEEGWERTVSNLRRGYGYLEEFTRLLDMFGV